MQKNVMSGDKQRTTTNIPPLLASNPPENSAEQITKALNPKTNPKIQNMERALMRSVRLLQFSKCGIYRLSEFSYTNSIHARSVDI